MSARESEVMHLVVTSMDGRVVHREHVSQSSYSRPSEYYRAVRNRRDGLVREYPKRRYRVSMVLAHSESPVALSGSSSG